MLKTGSASRLFRRFFPQVKVPTNQNEISLCFEDESMCIIDTNQDLSSDETSMNNASSLWALLQLDISIQLAYPIKSLMLSVISFDPLLFLTKTLISSAPKYSTHWKQFHIHDIKVYPLATKDSQSISLLVNTDYKYHVHCCIFTFKPMRITSFAAV